LRLEAFGSEVRFFDNAATEPGAPVDQNSSLTIDRSILAQPLGIRVTRTKRTWVTQIEKRLDAGR